jgi:hypothetical protein
MLEARAFADNRPFPGGIAFLLCPVNQASIQTAMALRAANYEGARRDFSLIDLQTGVTFLADNNHGDSKKAFGFRRRDVY